MAIVAIVALVGLVAMTSVLFLCTGNAARSVMAGVAFSHHRPEFAVDTAGTLSVDGLPISWRTRAALDAVSLPWPRHTSKQVTRTHLDAADVVIGMAPEHVEWVRRQYPFASQRTATLVSLVEQLEQLEPSAAPVGDRIAGLALAGRSLQAWEEVGAATANLACSERGPVMKLSPSATIRCHHLVLPGGQQ